MFVGSVALSSVVLIIAAARYFAASPKTAISLAVLVVVLLAVSGYAWHYVKRVYDPPFYEILDLNGHLVVERANGHRRYTYERRQTIVATRNDLRLIEFRAHWTGQGRSGSTRVESLRPEHAMLDGRRAESDGRVHRWIYPRRPLKRGQPVDVGIRQVHEDDLEEQLPYFREGGGRYKTNRITVTVCLPLDEHLPDSVRGVVWNSHHSAQQSAEVDDLVVQPRVDRATSTVDYTVTVDKPRAFHSYGVEWTWGRQPG